MAEAMVTSDLQIAQRIRQELGWHQRGSQTRIDVDVTEGIATLTGAVSNYVRKMEAEKIARHIAGISEVINRIQVQPSTLLFRADCEIAEAVRNALEWNVLVPAEHIRSTVENGWVRLEGSVSSPLQKQETERAVAYLLGVRGIINRITISPITSASH